MHRAFNFNAGPAALPQPVLERAAAEMLDYNGTGKMCIRDSASTGRRPRCPRPNRHPHV